VKSIARNNNAERTVASAQIGPGSRLARAGVVLLGILIGQAILYGPSLLGKKILLPLDCLAEQGVYIPSIDGLGASSRNPYLCDLVLLFEPLRRFAVSEIHAGRLPMWFPNEFCGSPYIEPRFSPFQAIQFCSQSPVIWAWTQFAVALVAGFGAYVFFRRVAGVGFWPASVCAWCYPVTAFFIFWLGYPVIYPVAWFPWVLVSVWEVIRGNPLAPPVLAIATWLLLASGHLDMAAQVLLTCGIFAVWSLYALRPKTFAWRFLIRKVSILTAAWAISLFLAAPFVLPAIEYSSAGARMHKRSSGKEERPPVGLSALPQIVLPDMYGDCGTHVPGSYRVENDVNQMESSAAGYASLLAALVLAPLALCNPRPKALNGFLIFASVLSLGWCLNIPGIVHLFRLPGLNMMSHNRLLFVYSIAILTMASAGLDLLLSGDLKWRAWLWLFPALLAGLCFWCGFRTFVPPEPVATELEKAVRAGVQMGWVKDIADVRQVQRWFSIHYLMALCWCAAGLGLWFLIWRRRTSRANLVSLAAFLMIAELMLFALGRNAQCDRALYYPDIEPLSELRRLTPGRIIGHRCLPAILAAAAGLRDVRGYDGVDPERMVEILKPCANEALDVDLNYASTQWLSPVWQITSSGSLRLPPILNMLDVRYVVFRGSPPRGVKATVQGIDYWALENSACVGRAFVPTKVEMVAEKAQRLRKLTAPAFDPKSVAYVEEPVDLPDTCRGSAKVLSETPTYVALEAQMETAGMVILTDRWDPGWRVTINGKPSPILKANHALRGVLLPTGVSKLEFRYAPASLVWGLVLAAGGFVTLLCWMVRTYYQLQSRGETSPTRNFAL
jgi:hypothetical protein